MNPLPVTLPSATNEPLSTLFHQFTQERRYLKNVTARTLEWYATAFQAYQRAVPGEGLPTKASIQRFVMVSAAEVNIGVSVSRKLHGVAPPVGRGGLAALNMSIERVVERKDCASSPLSQACRRNTGVEAHGQNGDGTRMRPRGFRGCSLSCVVVGV